MNQPLCPELWRSVTIDHLGNVYCCCLNKPCRIGSIYESDLSEIVNSEAAVKARMMNLNGELPCIDGCTWMRGPMEAGSPEVHYSNLRSLTVAFGEPCNIRCIMCKQRPRNDIRTLDVMRLIMNVDVSPFTSIFLTGGEPLYIRSCLEYMDYLALHGKRYGFSTNGTLLGRGFVDSHVGSLDFVTVSINAATKKTHESVNVGSDFDTVLSNVGYLDEVRRTEGHPVQLIARMTITVEAIGEIPEFIRRFGSWGFDSASFGFDRDTVPAYLSQHPDVRDDLRNDIVDAMGSVRPGTVDDHRLRILGLVGD